MMEMRDAGRKYWWMMALVVLMMMGVMWWPTEYRRVVREGTDSYETHYPLYGERVRSISIAAAEDVTGVGVLLVNLRRADELSEARVVISREGEVIAEQSIGGNEIQDDIFTWVDFGRVVGEKGEVFEMELSASEAEVRSAIGWRYEEETGLGAVAVVERVPVWKQIKFWVGVNEGIAGQLARVLVGGIMTAMILFWLGRDWRWGEFSSLTIGIGVLMGITIWLRWSLAGQIESAFGGDIFNYLLKSRAWLDGGDPFGADFRKAPLMSFLLLPGFLPGFDQVLWGKVISVTAAAGSVGLVVLVGKEVKLPSSVSLVMGLILSVNRELWWESAHGLANSLFAMLVLMAVYVFIRHRKMLSEYWLGVAASLVFLTRYEGGLVLAVLMPAVWWYKRSLMKMGRSLVPIIILLGMVLVMWPFSGQLGVRTPSDIAGDSGLYLVTTGEEWRGNLMAWRLYIGRLWFLQELVGDQLKWLMSGLVGGGLAFWLTARQEKYSRLVKRIVPILLMGWLLLTIGRGSEEMYKCLSLGVTGLMGVGIGGLLGKHRRIMGPVWIMAWLMWLVVTMILPKTRYYLWLVPLLTLALVYGLWIIGDGQRSRISRGATILLLSMWAMFIYGTSKEALSGQLSDYNEKSASQTMSLEAARWLVDKEGKVAVISGQELPLRVYLGEERIVLGGEQENDVEWLKKSDVKYVLETSAQPWWQEVIKDNAEAFEQIVQFETKFSDIRAGLYVLH